MKFLSTEWLKSALDDLESVKMIIQNPNLTNIVAFHAQQCIEKVFKAISEENNLKTQKIHDLVKLYGDVRGYLPPELKIDLDMLDKLNKLYIDSRYPSDLGLLPYGKPTLADAKMFYQFAKEIFDKVKAFLEKK